MPKPVCVPCRRFYRPHRNGTAFIEAMPRGIEAAPPGLEAPNLWEPYKLWMADLWRCPGCGNEIIIGAGFAPLREHFHQDFAEQVEKWKAEITINDC